MFLILHCYVITVSAFPVLAALLAAFSSFGPVRVEWPGKEARYAKSPVKPSAKGKGKCCLYYFLAMGLLRSLRSLLLLV